MTAKDIIADLARPFGLYAVFGSTAIAIVRLAWVGGDLNAAAIYIGAALAGCGAIYGAKAWEVAKASGHSAEVEKERAKASPPPEKALEPAIPNEGELPPEQRVKL